MPYSRTTARLSAISRIADLRISYTYAKKRSKQLPTAVRDAIYQNCVFQLSSAFEDYISDLLSTWIGNLRSRNAENKTLPKQTRALIVARSQAEDYKRYVGLGNEAELAERLLSDLDRYTIFLDDQPMPRVDIGALLVKDRKFPTPVNLEALFKRFGLPSLHAVMSKRTKSDFRLTLQAFMDIRNALAHESPPSITDVDVKRYFAQVEGWLLELTENSTGTPSRAPEGLIGRDREELQ